MGFISSSILFFTSHWCALYATNNFFLTLLMKMIPAGRFRRMDDWRAGKGREGKGRKDSVVITGW